MTHRFLLAGMLALAAQGVASAAEVPVSALKAAYRDGQVFVTWEEAETAPGTTFNVYLHDRPITNANLKAARRVAHHVERHSARDWWQDPASFDGSLPPGEPVGFVIRTGEAPLDPRGGLFVHTVTAESAGARYFAVTATDAAGVEDTRLMPGRNTLEKPVEARVAPIRPIWLGTGAEPAVGAGKGKALHVMLHARGGGKTAGPGAQAVNCLVFGNAKQGWREGLPFKFRVSVTDAHVRLEPCDRAWAGRPVTESVDKRDHCPAVNTFWYGYNSRIYETTRTAPKTVVHNYTEEQVLALVRWAQSYLGTDPNRTYLSGTSMGGSGSVSLALHYPDVFAAALGRVPIVSYTRRGGRTGYSLYRLECVCGPLDETAVTQDGRPLLEHMSGEACAARAGVDLPYLFLTHGRTDGSIPWENNPPFYRAMNTARQGFSVCWNNGDHSTADKLVPEDVKTWFRRLERFRLDQSFPAFSNASDSKECGDGGRAVGDLEGWMHRGLDWKDLVDTPSEYALTITADYPGIVYPLTVDVTPRRVQQFRVKPGQVVQATVGDAAPVAARADAAGRVTVRVTIADANGKRLRLTR